jgi:hypothetical protein
MTQNRDDLQMLAVTLGITSWRASQGTSSDETDRKNKGYFCAATLAKKRCQEPLLHRGAGRGHSGFLHGLAVCLTKPAIIDTPASLTAHCDTAHSGCVILLTVPERISCYSFSLLMVQLRHEQCI